MSAARRLGVNAKTDTLFFSGFNSGDQALIASALGHDQVLFSFTLSDNTTFLFIDSAPTHAIFG
jgi:hypothetical protein